MFTLIRIASALLLFVLCYFLLKALNVKGKKTILVSLMSSVLFVGIMACFPPENLLVRFDTPESAFRYTNTEEIAVVLYGKSSCDIIYKKSDNTYSDRIILQKGDSFQLPTILTEELVSRKVRVSRSGSFDVYRVNGTQDYYVFATLPDIVADHSELYVIHRSGQSFQSDKGHLVKINGTHFVCFYLPGPPEEYRLVVNGQEMIIAE